MKKILLSAVLFTALSHPLMADPMDYKNTENLQNQVGLSVLNMGSTLRDDTRQRYGSAMTQDVEMTVAANNVQEPAIVRPQQPMVMQPVTPQVAVTESLADINPAAGEPQPQVIEKETVVIGNTDTGVNMDAIRSNIKQRVID